MTIDCNFAEKIGNIFSLRNVRHSPWKSPEQPTRQSLDTSSRDVQGEYNYIEIKLVIEMFKKLFINFKFVIDYIVNVTSTWLLKIRKQLLKIIFFFFSFFFLISIFSGHVKRVLC